MKEAQKGRLARATGIEAETERFLRRARQNKENARKREIIRNLKSMSPEEVKKRLALTQADLDILDEIIQSPGRNSIAQLAALKLKAQFTVEPPQQRVSGDIGVQVIVNTMKRTYELPPERTNHTLEGDHGDVSVVSRVDPGSD